MAPLSFSLSCSLRRKLFISFVAVMTLFASGLYGYVRLATIDTPVISEVSFTNNDKQDWIEIYNPSMNSISLKGYYLSDSADDPTRFKIASDVIIPAHGTAVIFCQKVNDLPPGAIRTNFNLSSGESIVLTSPNGYQNLDRITLMGPDHYKGEYSVGRSVTKLDVTQVFYRPTPGEDNQSGTL